MRTKAYNLPKPDITFTLDELLHNLCSITLPSVKILVTGNGRVSQGAQYVLNYINAHQLSEEDYLSSNNVESLSFAVAKAESLVKGMIMVHLMIWNSRTILNTIIVTLCDGRRQLTFLFVRISGLQTLLFILQMQICRMLNLESNDRRCYL